MVWHLEEARRFFYFIYFTVVISIGSDYFNQLCSALKAPWILLLILVFSFHFVQPCLAFARPALQQGQRGSSSAQGYMKWNHRARRTWRESTTARERLVFYCRKTLLYNVWTHYNCNWTNPILELLQQPCSCTNIHHVNLRAIEKPEWRNSQYRTESARGSRSRDASLCVSCI